MNIRDMLKVTGFKSQALLTVRPDEFVSAAIEEVG